MLVRADLFAAARRLRPGAFPGSEDLDLCWRARLAGARVLVVPERACAHVRPPSGAERRPADVREHRPSAGASGVHVLLAPVAALDRSVRARAVDARGAGVRVHPPPAEAFAEVRVVVEPPAPRTAPPSPRRAQTHRTIHDSELTSSRSAGRANDLRSFLGHHHADERMGASATRCAPGPTRWPTGCAIRRDRVPRLPRRARLDRIAEDHHRGCPRRRARARGPACTRCSTASGRRGVTPGSGRRRLRRRCCSS